jgi:hypothetical protein
METFLKKYVFASTWIIARHLVTIVPMIKDIPQRELWMKTFSRRRVPHFLTLTQQVVDVEERKEMLRILQHCDHRQIWCVSVDEVPTRVGHVIATQKTILTLFLSINLPHTEKVPQWLLL